MEGLLLLLAVVVGAVLGAAFGIAFGATATGILIARGRGRPGAEKTPGDAPGDGPKSAQRDGPDAAQTAAERRRDARFAAILANIDLYDGTDAGQREIAEE